MSPVSDLKVVFAASEAAPLAKTGGLADVAGSLPPALARLGVTVSLLMPYYPQVEHSGLEVRDTGQSVTVDFAGVEMKASLWRADLEGCPVHLVRYDPFFGRDHLYGDRDGDFPDNLERFTFFNRAVCRAAQALDLKADLVHCHDWQTGLLPLYLKTRSWDLGPLAGAKSVFTIHNLAYQGLFARERFWQTGLPPALNAVEGLEYWGGISLLKGALLFADAVTTVSPNYAQEILTPDGGLGLDGVLARRAHDLVGIINGADYRVWSPANDTHLPVNYTAASLKKGKTTCREALLEAFGLEAPEGATVMGFIGRLTEQKGVDLLAEAAPRLMADEVRLVVLGTGEAKYEDALLELARAHPEKVAVKIAYSEKLAHLIQAGSDLLIMPSRFEPCGLNQIYALAYGTAPVVRATGGLVDTVEDFDPVTGAGDGFIFDRAQPGDLLCALTRALWTKSHPQRWSQLQANAMAQDFSWDQSAKEYLDLYLRLLGRA